MVTVDAADGEITLRFAESLPKKVEKNGAQTMIRLTDSAREKVLEFIEIEEKKGWALRLSATRHGPRRFQYELNLEAPEDKNDDDAVQDCGTFELWMDAASAENVGKAPPWTSRTAAFESGFKFDNPQTRWDDPLAQAGPGRARQRDQPRL